jgi:hypothetical protein
VGKIQQGQPLRRRFECNLACLPRLMLLTAKPGQVFRRDFANLDCSIIISICFN